MSQAEWAAVRPSRSDLLYCLKVFLSVRVALALVVVLATSTIPSQEPTSVPGWPPPEPPQGWALLVTPWERADALWYLRIATDGYSVDDGSPAFFPLFPLTIRGLSVLLGDHPLAAGLVISHVAFFAGLVLLHMLTKKEFGQEMARRSVLYISVFPSAFFFFAPLTESMFFALAVATLLCARQGWWALAAICGAWGAATRSVGVVLALAVVAEGITKAWGRWRVRQLLESALPALGAGAMVAGGALLYFAWWHIAGGDWHEPIAAQSEWQRELTMPWTTIRAATRSAFAGLGGFPSGYYLLDWVIVMPALAAAVWVALRAAPSFAVYTWASFLLPLMYVFEGRPLLSFPRFILPVFPVYWAFARLAERYDVHGVLVASFAMVLGIMTTLFVNWYFVF
jgi:hypothetical protein